MSKTYKSNAESVLVVDDNRCVRVLLKEVLLDAGFKVYVAGNGQEAVEKVAICRPAVVVMDFDMPIMNGVEATRFICKSNPLLPIVMLTANRTPELAVNAKIAGVATIIYKPINNDCFVSNVRQILHTKIA
ncbi:response regulator [Candidatus Uabimicrobium amorphum]|uniref:Response regulator n=1 Tax=Uabimicrobium amorphum TaxID=2596890 RepID=A0A5S9ILY3_UABAM|nr:response regulator [Candidatus Uabimicrobium amorphum]BBM83957.1 response regulator [Candidatus Uabimicrobium amorphum]